MQPVTTPEFVVDAGAIAVIDGHDGVGHVLTMLATHEAIKRARAHGIGAKDFDEVFYPGEIEDNNDTKFRREGLALPEETMADLRRIAKHTGLAAKLPAAFS